MAFLSSILLLASAQVTAAVEPSPSEVHNFMDWVVTCDNTLRCEATSLVPEQTPGDQTPEAAAATPDAATPQDPWERYGYLKLQRDGGGDTPLRMVIGDFEGTPARLVLNDAPLAARLTPTDTSEWLVEPENRNAFIDQLYYGDLQVQDANGRTLSEIALNGLWEALVYIDERQGRLRTTTALLRRGRRPASVVPAAVPVPVVQVAPRTSERALTIPAPRMAQARREFGCTEEEVGAVASSEAETHALGNGRTLVMMACGAGAYNYQALPLIARQDGRAIRIEAARFDIARDPIEGEPEPKGYFVTNAEFDPTTMTIGEYAKGRGLGDCGVAATYGWDGEAFRLLQQEEMSECRGSRELLTTWRTERR